MFSFLSFGGGSRKKDFDVELSHDFSVKSIFGPEFTLNSVDLLETIGTGTFSRIRLVRSLVDKQYYALKIMKKSKIVRLNQLEHTQNEVRILSRLRSQYCVELYAMFQDDNSLYLLMEYVPGGELFSHLRRDIRFDFPVYQFYTVELVCGIQHMHSLNIMYRDIKAENIVLNRDGHIRFVDFGFAKIVTDKTYTLCGTPEYLAPEIIHGQGYGIAVDWWSLGILVHEMACGYPPFFGDNPFDIYKKILDGKFSFPFNLRIPKSTQSVIRGFLVNNRSKRLGSGSGGFSKVKSHKFFKGVEWNSAAKQLIMPPVVPTVASEGDTSNFDFFPEEGVEESCKLTQEQREMFYEFDRILERPIQT